MDSPFPRLSREQRLSLEAAAQKYNKALPGSPAEQHLAERGIGLEVANGALLGYCADPETGHEMAKGRLSIAYTTPGGVVDIRFRTLGDEEPKYLSLSGATPHLFGVCQLHKAADYVAICEGELDAVVMSGLCDVPAVAIPGARAWKRWWRHLFSDFRVLIVMDGDEAGRNAATKIRKDLSEATVVRLPDGMDCNDLYLNEGADGVRAALGV